MRTKLHFYLNDSKNKYAKILDIFINIIVVFSVIDFSLGTIPGMNEKIPILGQLYEAIIIFFSLEYLIRLYAAPNRVKYIFSVLAFFHLIALLPYFIGVNVDLRSIRIIYMLKLFKHNKSVINISSAFHEVKSELLIFSLFTLFLLFISAVGIYHFENPVQPDKFKSIFESMWWSVATLTTVGYGDIFPITNGGKLFASFIVFIGLGVVSVPTALIATSFMKAFKKI